MHWKVENKTEKYSASKNRQQEIQRNHLEIKSCLILPKATKSYRKAAKSNQKRPNAAKNCQKLPKTAKSVQ